MFRCGSIAAVATAGIILAMGCDQAGAQSDSAAEAVGIARLAVNVERAAAVRAVKELQVTYAQYSQFGLWDEMAALFADEAEMIRGEERVSGRTEIGAWFLEVFGNGEHGLPPGGLHTQLVFRPLINLSADGQSARGRWWEWSMIGRFGGDARWAGGIYENEYIREGGVWKFARVHYYPMVAGDYETGWRNVYEDQKVVPYHFTTDETGIPVPEVPPSDRTVTVSADHEVRLQDLESRIMAMNAEDDVRNLQNAYGYYVDRKMWNDVTDLFTLDAVLEIGNVGLYQGPEGIRRALERMGPAGLRHGELNDHMQLDTIVSVAADGREARSRGIEFGLLGNVGEGTAFYTLAVFSNRYVRENGIWRIREMRIFPIMKTDYYEGWAQSAVIDAPPAAPHAPDSPVAVEDRMTAGAIPAFFSPNPVTGRPVTLPDGARAVGTDRLLPLPEPIEHARREAGIDPDVRLAEAERRLAVSKARDGVENVSAAYGDYLDDLDFGPLAEIFAEQGNKEIPFTGFYVTRASIAARDSGRTTPGATAERPPRTTLPLHLRTQPVIHVAPDGRSAAIRTRLFQPLSYRNRSAGFGSGMYNDQAVLEDGIWRLWSVAIDEHYFQSAGYAGGWSGVEPQDPAVLQRQGGATSSDYPPDIPLRDLGERERGFRGGTGTTLAWPSILPMWFHYRNPVSGREPEHYWPDCVPCVRYPETSMTRHGYTLPPD